MLAVGASRAAARVAEAGRPGHQLGRLRGRRQRGSASSSPTRSAPRSRSSGSPSRCRRRRSRSRTSASTSTAASTTRASCAPPSRTSRPARRSRAARRSPSSSCATSTSARERTLQRKIREAKLAEELEDKHSKKLDPRELPQLGRLRNGRRPDRGRRPGRRADVLLQARQGPDARGVGAARRAAAGAQRAQPVPEPARRARAAQRGAAARWPSSATSPRRAPPRRRQTPLGVQARRPLHADPRAVLLRLRQAAADRQVRRQHRAQGRAEGLHDDRSRSCRRPAARRSTRRSTTPATRAPPWSRSIPRNGYIRAMASSSQLQAQAVQPRRPGPPPARLGVQDLRADDRDQARRQPEHDQLRLEAARPQRPRTTGPGRSRPTTRPTAAR